MRIGHTGDLHVAEGARLGDAERALAFIADEGRRQGVEAWLVGGDLSGTACPHVCRIVERRVLVDFFLALAAEAPVVCIQGNHDTPGDFVFLRALRAAHPIAYLERPDIVHLGALQVACLPFPSKRWAIAGGAIRGGLEEQKAGMEAGLRAILAEWQLDAARTHAAGVPIVGLMHLNIGGSRVTGSEILIGREVELAPHDLTELGFDAGFLSHIHRAQEMAPGWHYAGSPYRQNHGEADYTPSFTIADVQVGAAPRFSFVETPSRALVTVDVCWERGAWTWEWQENDRPAPDARDADVRLRVLVNEADAATCSTTALVEQFTADGAHAVTVERRVLPKTRVRSDTMAAAITTADKVRAYWAALGTTAPPAEQRARCLTKLAELEIGGAVEGRQAA